MVKLTEDAEVALPQRVAGQTAPKGSGDVLPDPEKLKLPDKLESPETMSDKLQALRVELIHALFRRGGKAEPRAGGGCPEVPESTAQEQDTPGPRPDLPRKFH